MIDKVDTNSISVEKVENWHLIDCGQTLTGLLLYSTSDKLADDGTESTVLTWCTSKATEVVSLLKKAPDKHKKNQQVLKIQFRH